VDRVLSGLRFGARALPRRVLDYFQQERNRNIVDESDHSCHVPGTMGTRDGNGGRESLLATNREQLGYTSL
jgi:hypothetical protein